MRSPLWTPTCILAAVFLFLWGVIIRLTRTTPAKVPSLLWSWSDPAITLPSLNDAADFATLVSLPIAAIALSIAAYEQYRVSQELRRRPKIVFGFKSDRDPSTRMMTISETEKTVGAEYWLGERYSRTLKIVVHSANIGGRVAEHALWNIDFPPYLDIQNKYDHGRRYERDKDGQRILPNVPTLNPQDVNVMTFNIRVPTGTTSFWIRCGVSASELLDSVVTLTVNVNRKDVS